MITDGRGTTWLSFDANRDFTYKGLEPGEYEIEIRDASGALTEKKAVRVADGETSVSFVVDASMIRPWY